MRDRYFPIAITSLILLSGCSFSGNSYDENFIPYGIKGFDVWVYNDNTDKEYYAGRVTTNYSQAQEKLSDAQRLAYDIAEAKYLKDWSYICCTVTNSSNCVTKVR